MYIHTHTHMYIYIYTHDVYVSPNSGLSVSNQPGTIFGIRSCSCRRRSSSWATCQSPGDPPSIVTFRTIMIYNDL